MTAGEGRELSTGEASGTGAERTLEGTTGACIAWPAAGRNLAIISAIAACCEVIAACEINYRSTVAREYDTHEETLEIGLAGRHRV
jgi:hypothetical protein